MTIDGRVRAHASLEGNALAVCSRLGLAQDRRVEELVHRLKAWQWPDGGWNCDKAQGSHHSSFYESLAPMWGLWEYHRATGDAESQRAARRTAEFFLRHRMFRSESTGDIINAEWVKLHYPLYWHYDVLQGLLRLSEIGVVRDARAQEALDLLESMATEDGRWKPGGYYWWPQGKRRSNIEVVDWGRRGPNEMITLNALRVLSAAGRLH